MFYAIASRPDFWKERLNLYFALAPVTRIDHTSNQLVKLAAEFGEIIVSTTDFLHVYYILGNFANLGTKLLCGAFPRICKMA